MDTTTTTAKDDTTRDLERLARTNRGPGSARLSMDSQMLKKMEEAYDQCFNDDDGSNNLRNNHNIPNIHAVNVLSTYVADSCSPVLAPNNVPIYRVERGGQVTYHGPGQLVVYPLLDLKQGPPFREDLHWFLHQVEEVIIRTCSRFGILGACRDDVNTGVWVKEQKVAAVGVAASRWITTHGFALNVDPDLSYFDTSVILPCGIEGRGVTSIARLLREQKRSSPTAANVTIPTVHEVASIVLEEMKHLFQISLNAPHSLET